MPDINVSDTTAVTESITFVRNNIKTVKPSGGDYTSLSGWEAGRQADLTAISSIEAASIEGDWSGGPDTAILSITGWTTSSSCYATISPNAANRHAGVWDSTKYIFERTVTGDSEDVIYISDAQYTRIDGLQIKFNCAYNTAAIFVASTADECRFSNIIIRGNSCSSADARAFTCFPTAGKAMYVWNCLVYGMGIGWGLYAWGDGTVYVYSCTFIDCNHGATRLLAGTLTVKNCYAAGGGSDAYYSFSTLTTSAANDTTGSAAALDSVLVSTTADSTHAGFVNVSSGTEDFHIKAHSPLLGTGTITSGESAPLNFTTDITGATRGGSAWDIGAFELNISVKTVKSSGGDYSSLSGWEAGEQLDLTVPGMISEASIEGTWSSPDATATQINSWTTSSSFYPRIVADLSNRAGTSWSTSKYILQASSSDTVLGLWEDYTIVDGLQINYAGTGAAYVVDARYQTDGANQIVLKNCFLRAYENTSTESRVLMVGDGDTDILIYNCIMVGGQNSDYAAVKLVDSNATMTIYSSIIRAKTYCLVQEAGSLIAKNVYCGGGATADFSGTITMTTCASSDTTGSAAALRSIAVSTTSDSTHAGFVNVTPGSEDFRIKAHSPLLGTGTITSGDSAPMNFTTDIAGQTRAGSAWDIGAFELNTSIKTVKPSAGDYTTLAGWEAGEQGDLRISGMVSEASIEGTWSSADTAQVDTSGWETGAACYIYIHTSGDARHAGVYSTSKYLLKVTNTDAFQSWDKYVRIDGLQIEVVQTSVDNIAGIYVWREDATSDVRISNCIIRGPNNTSYNAYGIYVVNAGPVHIWNCVIYYFEAVVGSSRCILIAAATVEIYNCTCQGGWRGIYNASGTVTVKNCYAGGAEAGYCYSGSFTMVTCASGDTTGTVGLQNIAVNTSNFVNVTPGSEDFDIPSGSALKDVGTDTSGDAAPMNFTTDIIGTTRATWDIGAFEYLFSGGVTISISVIN